MEARNRSLLEWFDRIRSGQLRLPRFQRSEVWDYRRVCSLQETVLRDLPAGAALILEVGDEEVFISRVLSNTPVTAARVTEHLLDGQQRLTALWKSFHDLYPDRKYFLHFKEHEENPEEKLPCVFAQARFRARNGSLYPLWADEPDQIHQKEYIPLRLLCPEDLGGEVRDWCDRSCRDDLYASRELELRIQKLRERVRSYNLPFLSLPAATKKDVALQVFIRLNTTAVQLDAYDIMVAQVEDFNGRKLRSA